MSISGVQGKPATSSSQEATDFGAAKDKAASVPSGRAGRASYAQQVNAAANLADKNPKAFWRRAQLWLAEIKTYAKVYSWQGVEAPISNWRTLISVIAQMHRRHPDRIINTPSKVPFLYIVANTAREIDNLDNKFQPGVKNRYIPGWGLDRNIMKFVAIGADLMIRSIKNSMNRIPGR